MSEPMLIKDVLADPEHPAHEAAKQVRDRLAAGALNLCACMGPAYDEPYCVCEMKTRGLPLNEEARFRDGQKFRESMERLFGPGGEYAK